jgi:hypothetical protein
MSTSTVDLIGLTSVLLSVFFIAAGWVDIIEGIGGCRLEIVMVDDERVRKGRRRDA